MQRTFILLRKVRLLKRHNISYWIDRTKRNYFNYCKAKFILIEIDLQIENKAILERSKKYKITKISE